MPAPSDETPSDAAAPSGTARRQVRRPAGLRWYLALLVVPLPLTAVLLGFRTGSNDDTATQPVTATSPVTTTAVTGTPVPVAVAPFSVVRTGSSVSLKAAVPDQAAKDVVLAAVQSQLLAGGTLVEEITVDAAAGLPDLRSLDMLLRTLAMARGDVSARYDGKLMTLTGDVEDQATKATAARAAAATVPGAAVANQLRVPNAKPPREISVCDTPQTWLDRLVAQNPVLFLAGTAQTTADAKITVAKVAALLNTCGTVRIQVSGHTDNLGDASTSIPLSVQRAIAVKADLARLAVAADRITVKGFGEARPLRSNDTPAGRIVNRRVEFRVR